ncbi:MAG: hypothetical protein FJ146_04170 [Deltaproteobacteria bacterium]|nr:hypothetical protein [Deltaproteobacteria bacterium]
MRAIERNKKNPRANSKSPSKVNERQKKNPPPKPTKSSAKSKALAAVDALLRQPEPKRVGASAAGRVRPVMPNRDVPDAGAPTLSRFERCMIRAEKGEPGPILVKDLLLSEQATVAARKSGRIDLYKKILKATPTAQPGRPLVNIIGTSDEDLRFQLLSLHDLVLAASELGREQLQVSLVRLSEAEAERLLLQQEVNEPLDAEVSPLAIARMNGFLQLPLASINRDENLRQDIDSEGAEFKNLISSIETIGLQNPPVVEVRLERDHDDSSVRYVCVSGHRRLLALEHLGQTEVVCALKQFKSERHRALAGLAENINREDLHFLDKADGYGLLARQGMSVHEIAALLDADQRTVAKYLRASAWDGGVKKRLRELGSKVTTRFLLNMLAAGERTTSELHALIDRFSAHRESKLKLKRGAQMRAKLDEFCNLSEVSREQRQLIEKALKFLGIMR